MMSNHQSHYDIPVLFSVLGSNLRMITKQELFAIPIFGSALRTAGFVPVDRSRRDRALQSLGDARSLLQEGTNVWIAPEGTRSATGALLPFKKGGFYLAQQTKAVILPITIDGTKEILAAHAWQSTHYKTVHVTIHSPIETAQFPDNDDGRTSLMQRVREVLRSGLREVA